MLDYHVTRYQEARLNTSERTIYEELTSFYSLMEGRHDATRGFRRTIRRQYNKLVMSQFFSLDLGTPPSEKGDTSRFKERLDRVLDSFKAHNKFMFPLKRPISVILLYSPSGNQSADLDNLARRVIPRIHEKLVPPKGIGQTLKLEDLPEGEIRSCFGREIDEMPKQPKHSVLRYEVIKVPELFDDLDRGSVSLVLGNGLMPTSWWRSLDGFLDKWADEVEC